jgi:xanthine dehydrogenase accessory factor
MNELASILDAWRYPPDRKTNAVLATVVHVTGSAYRRPGARMLILPDGRHIGGISGGCLEGEVIKRAWWLTNSETPVLRVYDTTSEDDAVWEFGLGCNGVVHVLLERANSVTVTRMLEFIDDHRLKQTPAVVATVIRSNDAAIQVGDRLLADESEMISGELAASPIRTNLINHSSVALAEQKSCLVHLSEADVFIEFVAPPLSLVIFGAGHDAIPLAHIAAQLGWDITVADGRPAYARPERFPGAKRVVTMQGNDPIRDIDIDEHSAVVLMTHNFTMDVRLLPLILDRGPRYLGLLGPRARAERLFDELSLVLPSTVHAPVGLDIGCDTPETIALSIAADIQATISHRNGGLLLHRNGSIHAPAPEIGCGPSHRGARPAYCETMAGSNV